MADGTPENGGENTGRREIVGKHKLYIAAAFGTFFLCMGDCLYNGKLGTICLASGKLKELLDDPTGTNYVLPAVAIFIIMGIGLCWVHNPGSLVDAFNRGCTIFAVMALLATSGARVGLDKPNNPLIDAPKPLAAVEQGKKGEVSLFMSTRVAHAETAPPGEHPRPPVAVKALGKAIIIIPSDPSSGNNAEAFVTLRSGKSLKLVGVDKVVGNKISIQQPIGDYLLEVEGPGFRKAQTWLHIDDSVQTYYLPLQRSSIPYSVQRMVLGNEEIKLERLSEEDNYRELGVAAFRARNYNEAVKNYDKYLALNPRDCKVLDFKGYSLFRAQRYEEALDTLDLALRIDPDYFFARLNKAKVLCALDRRSPALETMRGRGALTADQLRKVAGDDEFRRVCKQVYAEVVSLGR